MEDIYIFTSTSLEICDISQREYSYKPQILTSDPTLERYILRYIKHGNTTTIKQCMEIERIFHRTCFTF